MSFAMCLRTARAVHTLKENSLVDRKRGIRWVKSRDSLKKPLNNPCFAKQRNIGQCQMHQTVYSQRNQERRLVPAVLVEL